ncbi:MAG: isoprenyl transferase [Eubacteriales bacterium]|nr:isoprenyl transferase [Eubacteriales bacterium]
MDVAAWFRGLFGAAQPEKEKPAQPMQLPPKLPAHVAIIMDGNGRWAKQRNLPRAAGHQAGTEALRGIIRFSSDIGIKVLTIYAFSTENWSRSRDEVDALMALLLRYFRSEIDELCEENVRIRILGDVDGLPLPQKEAVLRAMERSKDNTGLTLAIALNYGGRQELLHAAKQLAKRAQAGEDPDGFTQQDLQAGLYTGDLPDVDLLIRTSGEQRLSNMLPWQSVYAELLFDPVLWPDFTKERYLEDLWEYAKRDRRFGGRNEAPKERQSDV